jgi:hypothetical protein
MQLTQYCQGQAPGQGGRAMNRNGFMALAAALVGLLTLGALNLLGPGTVLAAGGDGTLKWSLPKGGNYSAPALGQDGTIYYTTQGSLQAVKSDGTEKWEYFVGSC